MRWLSVTAYSRRIQELSARLIRAQQPIRILEALRIDEDIQAAVLQSRFKELPAIDAAYYHTRRPLPYDPRTKIEEFAGLEKDIRRDPGEKDELGAILIRNCEQYRYAVQMLMARGTPDFFRYSRLLYGSPHDTFPGDRTTIHDSAAQLCDILSQVKQEQLGVVDRRDLSAETVVERLSARYAQYFAREPDPERETEPKGPPEPGREAEQIGPAERKNKPEEKTILVRLDDGIVSDAAAGADYVKIRRGAMFSERDVDLLERHEGWVHVGTSLNGNCQRVASFLSKGPPCVSDVQEGLAVTMELLTFTTSPMRMKKLNLRVLACSLALDGANFLEVCEFFRNEGYPEAECVRNAVRVFRGGVIGGGAPFTKDIGYCKGFVKVYNFMRTAVRFGRPELLPFLFAGKLAIEDVPALYRKYQEGIVDPPRYLPPHFRDLNGLAMWMAYSNFFNRMELGAIQDYYRGIL